MTKLLLLRANAREAGAVEGVEVLGAETLGEVLEYLSGECAIGPTGPGYTLRAPRGGSKRSARL